jgi:adenosylcobyric acid synthase
MNPILLKPEAEARSQVVVLGKATQAMSAREYYRRKTELRPVTLAALERLRSAYDVVVIEGAGSPAEINLRSVDLVNMGLAREVAAPVLLVGDIDRGGVFAHLVGTLELLEPEDRALVRGFIINKFRGDKSILDPGISLLEARTGVPNLGVVPYVKDHRLPEEDSVVLDRAGRPQDGAAVIDIAVLKLPRISNFTDFEPLEAEPGVAVRYVETHAALGRPDVLVIPGTKSTMADLRFLRESGLAAAVQRHAGGGGFVLGVCGGLQMLGQTIRDPLGVESDSAEAEGLGLLPLETVFEREKTTVEAEGMVLAAPGLLGGLRGAWVVGYEIHSGQSRLIGEAGPLLRLTSRGGWPVDTVDGLVNPAGNVAGTYLHGLFDSDQFRHAFLQAVAERKGAAWPPPDAPAEPTEDIFDRLAGTLRQHLDVSRIYAIAGLDG